MGTSTLGAVEPQGGGGLDGHVVGGESRTGVSGGLEARVHDGGGTSDGCTNLGARSSEGGLGDGVVLGLEDEGHGIVLLDTSKAGGGISDTAIIADFDFVVSGSSAGDENRGNGSDGEEHVELV